MDSTIDGACVFALLLTICLPISEADATNVVPVVWQPIRSSLLPYLEVNAVRIQDLSYFLVAEVSTALIGRSRVPEKSAHSL